MLIGLLIESEQVKPKIETWEEIALVGGISTTGSLVGSTAKSVNGLIHLITCFGIIKAFCLKPTEM